MATRKSKAGKEKDKKAVAKELFEALDFFEQERGIPTEYMIEKIKAGITSALKHYEIFIDVNREENIFDVYILKVVVEEVRDANREILLDEAVLIDPKYHVGDVIRTRLDTREVSRIAAQTAKHVIRQGIREVERGQVMDEMRSKHQELVTATIERIDQRSGTAYIKLGSFEVALPKSEQIEGEELYEGKVLKIFVVNIKDGDKDHAPNAVISRTHPSLVKKLLEAEVPEIADGTVEIKAVSREAGSRTKIAVFSNNPEVDAVGSCIGKNKSRINSIVDELGEEKIDVIAYSENPIEFISNALQPAKVVSVEMDEENPKACRVRVPDSQLSLAIGHKGQNARLAARLTGFKIDIRPESGYYGEEV